MKTKLKFRYSNIYDMNIAKWLGEKWENKYIKKGTDYCREIQLRWDKINDEVFITFESFGFELSDCWFAYPVTYWDSFSPFSDPLTFAIDKNWNKTFSVIIHELAHIEVSFAKNHNLKNKIYKHLKKRLPNEARAVRVHVVVNVLQEAVVKKVLKNYRSLLDKEAFVKNERHPGAKKAWVIIGNNKHRLDLNEPIDSLLKL